MFKKKILPLCRQLYPAKYPWLLPAGFAAPLHVLVPRRIAAPSPTRALLWERGPQLTADLWSHREVLLPPWQS